MSNSIDTRIVEMKFDNAAFERGAATSMKTLQNLAKATELKGAHKGLDELGKSASRLNLSGVASNIQNIASRFTTMGVVGVTALASIAHQAIATGAQMLKSLTTDPLMNGLREYETNLNSIQTILANTGLEGNKGLQQVNHALDELNHYSDKTIYNFSEMARNIGTFTAAGIKLEPATAAIKGIANLAAVSGSNAEQASTAMYQLSQAMAAGKATLVDWNSVVNAGMGGKVFQEALKETARVQGVAIDDIIEKNGSFRDSLQEGWLTTSVLTDTLAKFTGDLTETQLKAMGYNDKQIAGIIKMGKTAQDAATKVKTVSQLIGTLQEAVGSGWSKTFQTLFGDFDEARTLFTNVNNVLGGFIQSSADARNKVLSDWKALGGRTVLIQAIGQAFKNVMQILTPIKNAFKDIFPPATGKQLFEITKSLRDFLAGAALGSRSVENLRRTFRGFFAIFSIGISVVKGIARVIGQVFDQFDGAGGGLLEFTGNIGDWIVALDKAIKSGTGFNKFFDGVAKVIIKPIELIKQFVGYLKQVSKTVDEVSNVGAERIAKRFEPLGKVGELIGKGWSKLGGILKKVLATFQPLVDIFSDFFADLGTNIEDQFGDIDYNSILDGINTGLLAGLVLILRGFLKNGLKLDLGSGLLDNISGAFGGLTKTMTAMQTQLKAGALMKIAAAIALLTVSVVALSMIDPKKLAAALSGLTIMFLQLLGAMAIFEKITASSGFLKMPFLTGALIGLAIAVDVLAIAVSKLSSLSWEELAKGLTGVAVILGALALYTKFADIEKGGVKSAAGLILLAYAIKILVDSVQDLSGMNWEEMAKGLAGVAVLLGSLALFTKFAAVDKGGVLSGVGLILLATAIKIMASAVKDLSGLSWTEMAKGLTAMAGGLAVMAAAIGLIPPSSLLSAAGIFIVAKSLSTIGDAVKKMGQLSWEEISKGIASMAGALAAIALALALLPPSSLLSAAAIFVVAASLGLISDALGEMGGRSLEEIAKGLGTLAIALGIIAGAMALMQAALPGAAALLVVAASLRILQPVLQAFGDMDLAEIGKSLLMLAGVFAVIGVSGLVLAPLVPVLLGLGAAIALMGGGMLAAGAGLLLFSSGLAALAVGGGAAIAVLIGTVKALAMMIPMVMEQIAIGIVAFAKVIEKGAPAIVAAIVAVLMSLMNAIIKLTPKIVQTLGVVLSALLALTVSYAPKIAAAGVNLLLALMRGLKSRIGDLVGAATDLMVKFIQAISNNQAKLLDAGAKMIIAFINNVAATVRNNSGALREAGLNLGAAIVDGMTGGLATGVGKVVNAAKNIAGSALNAAKAVLDSHSPSREFIKLGKSVNDGFRIGLDGNKGQIDSAFNNLRGQLVTLMNDSARKVTELKAKLRKLNSARKLDIAAIRETTAALAQARGETTRAQNAFNLMRGRLSAEQKLLGTLANKYDVYTAKIKSAQDALNNAIKVRDDYKQSIQDKFSALPDITAETKLSDYFGELRKQTADTKKFGALLAQLRKLGLDDRQYKNLLEKGPEVMPFLEQLLASGKSGVSQLNSLGIDLANTSSRLGMTASKELYQAGVNAAQGFLDGLKKQQAAIEKQMDYIAARMIAAIKKALGIKSPSTEFAEVGKFAAQGISVGLDKYSIVVAKSAKNVGIQAIDSLRKTMSSASAIVTTDDRFNPVIRPVLDLTDVQSKAAQLNTMLASKSITVETAYLKASDASTRYRDNQLAQRYADVDQRPSVEFTQNNYSPKALSNAEIYRQTNNQISKAKGALTP